MVGGSAMQAVSGKTNWPWAADGATTIYNYKETPCDVSVTAIVVLIHCKLSVSDLTFLSVSSSCALLSHPGSGSLSAAFNAPYGLSQRHSLAIGLFTTRLRLINQSRLAPSGFRALLI